MTATRPWSCDTFLVAGDRTPDGVTLFGKNSDRPAGETQPLRHHAARHGSGPVQLAYLEIPDVEQTYAHLGASPWWCWGHEIGVNERGVAIGNEALFTRPLADAVSAQRDGRRQQPGILGMELLRLGLERAATAEQALEVMTALLEEYGQWGTGVGGQPAEEGAYDNAYVIADASGGWVLETAGRHWAARRVDSGTCSLSNQPTIRADADRTSAGLVEAAVDAGWWSAAAGPELDFARAVTDPRTPLQASVVRLQRSRQLLAEGPIDPRRAMGVLRDHYEGTFLDGPFFTAALPDLLTLCMHEHPAGFTWGNTASSLVCTLPDQDDLATGWWAAGTPCTGVYVPVWVAAGRVPTGMDRGGSRTGPVRPPESAQPDRFDRSSYWWRFLQLLEVAKDGELAWRFAERQPVIRAAFDRLEEQWLEQAPGIRRRALVQRDHDDRAAILADFSQRCADQAVEALERLLAGFDADPATIAERWAV